MEVENLKSILLVAEKLLNEYQFPKDVFEKYIHFKELKLTQSKNSKILFENTIDINKVISIFSDFLEISFLKFFGYIKCLSSFFGEKVDLEKNMDNHISIVIGKLQNTFSNENDETKTLFMQFKTNFEQLSRKLANEYTSLKDRLHKMRENIECSEKLLDELNKKNEIIQKEFKQKEKEILKLRTENEEMMAEKFGNSEISEEKMFEIEEKTKYLEKMFSDKLSKIQSDSIKDKELLLEVENLFTKLAKSHRNYYKGFCLKYPNILNSKQEFIYFYKYLVEELENNSNN